jgi:hypothetical protein
MRDLLYDLSQETIYYRFMSHQERFGQRQIQNFRLCRPPQGRGHRRNTCRRSYGDEIIVVGRYYLDEHTNRAEVAFVVRDEWQNRGLGHLRLQASGQHSQSQRYHRIYRRSAAQQQSDAGNFQPLGIAM